MKEAKPQPSLSLFEQWEKEGQPCSYVRFHAPLPRQIKQEPVYEFTLTSKDAKYVVDSIVYHQHALLWRAGGELEATPLANVQYARAL